MIGNDSFGSKGVLLDIYEFEDGIRKGVYSDAKGKATILINDAPHGTYCVHIDRKIVSSSGSIVSFASLLKEHGAENLKILYEEKECKLPDLGAYREFQKEQREKKKRR